MRLRHILEPSLFGKSFTPFIQEKLLLSKSKLKNFLKLILFILYLLLIGFQILFPSPRNKVRFVCVLITVISIGISLKIITRLLLLTKSLMIVPTVKYFPLWMVSLGIIRLTYFLQINIKLLLYVLGVPFLVKNSPLDSRIMVLLLSGLCLILFMILSILYNHILTIYMHTLCDVNIIYLISMLYSLDVIFTIFA
jgi:hypothetical protein